MQTYIVKKYKGTAQKCDVCHNPTRIGEEAVRSGKRVLHKTCYESLLR